MFSRAILLVRRWEERSLNYRSPICITGEPMFSTLGFILANRIMEIGCFDG
jgi:hypothetical protein